MRDAEKRGIPVQRLTLRGRFSAVRQYGTARFNFSGKLRTKPCSFQHTLRRVSIV
jgi:hypothetical protein